VFMHPNNAESIVKPDALQGYRRSGERHRESLRDDIVLLAPDLTTETLDRFPGLKVCGAHAGGYLPSYFGRVDVACDVRPTQSA